MQTTCGRATSSLIERLLAQPHRFRLFQAVQLIVQWLDEQGISQERALHDCLRFEDSLSLNFPVAEIEALMPDVCIDELDPNSELAGQPRRIRITPTFMGLLGSSGALPYHYTERFHQVRCPDEPGGSKAFFDLFTNRLVALAYECWRKYRLELPRAEPAQSWSALLLALAGHAPMSRPDVQRRTLEDTIAFHAGVLQQRPVSAPVLAAVLTESLNLPVTVEEGVGYWEPLATTEQIRIGKANATLGEDTLLGSSTWRPDLRARLRIGPLDDEKYRQFVPEAFGRKKLKDLLFILGNPGVVYEIRVVVRADAIRPMCLNSSERPPQLGCDTFLIVEPHEHDRADLHFEIRLIENLPPLGDIAAISATN